MNLGEDRDNPEWVRARRASWIVFLCTIGLLVTLRLKAVRTQGRLMLAGLRENIAGVLEIMQIAQLFEIHKSVDEALAALQS